MHPKLPVYRSVWNEGKLSNSPSQWGKRMKAVVYRRFGGPEVLQYEEAPEPKPAEEGVLIALKASALNVIDIRSRDGLMFPFVSRKFPKIPGIDVAGIVVSSGAKARRFQPGDRVFGAGGAFQGGAFAERVVAPEAGLARIPEGVSFEAAATLPTTGLAALYALRELGGLKRGQRVLLHGGTGAAGLMAIQIAKAMGAEVTSVSGASGLALARKMGADVALDYRAAPVPLNGRYDVIVNFSSAFPFGPARRWLAERGRFVEASPNIPKFIGSLIANPLRAQKHLMLQTAARTKDLDYLAHEVASGALKPTIAGVYPLSEAATAFRKQEAGGVAGKLVLTV